MTLDRLLWHQVDMVVEADLDEPLGPMHVRQWISARARLLPRAGGVTVAVAVSSNNPLGGVLCRTSGEALRFLEQLVRARENEAAEVEGTATAQYHRDCAMRLRALACVVRARAGRLWPAEAIR